MSQTLEQQINAHNETILAKLKMQNETLFAPEAETITFAAPLSAAGVKINPIKMRENPDWATHADDKLHLQLSLDGDFYTNIALISKLETSWSKGNTARQDIVNNYIRRHSTIKTGFAIDTNVFKKEEFANELISLQKIILDSQAKAITYNQRKCTERLSQSFNVNIAAPSRGGIESMSYLKATDKTIAVFGYYIDEKLNCQKATQNAVDNINKEFNKAGLNQYIEAMPSVTGHVNLLFDRLEHQAILAALEEHSFNFAPIVQSALNEAKQERRDNMGFFARGLEDLERNLLG